MHRQARVYIKTAFVQLLISLFVSALLLINAGLRWQSGIPALLNLPVRFRAWHYLPLLVLHLSLLIRISGDLIGSGDVRRWGGMLNGLAILLFLIVTVISVWQGRQHASVVRETPIDNSPLLD